MQPLQTIKMRWIGIRPILMHSSRLVDPTDPRTQRLQQAVTESKGAKNQNMELNEVKSRLEWEAGIYWTEQDGLHIPAEAVLACLKEGAKKSRQGKQVTAAVITPKDVYPILGKYPKTLDGLWEEGYYKRCPAKVGQARVIRTRAEIPAGWIIEPEFEFNPADINASDIYKHAEAAGRMVGILDWRPRYGRFEVELID